MKAKVINCIKPQYKPDFIIAKGKDNMPKYIYDKDI